MNRFLAMPLAAVLAACATPSPAPMGPADYAAVLAAAARPEADTQRDAARKPAEVLAFAQIAPGERVGDYIMGSGYFTRVLAAAVGPAGKVYAFQPAEFIAYRSAYAEEQDATVAALANAEKVRGPVAAPPFPEPLDTIVTIQNFHDLYLEAMPAGTPARAAAALYAALKPGGTLVVIDHSAAAGDSDAPDSLHRIVRGTVVDALTAARFRLEQDSALFANAADPHTALVFDPAIRGATDQFMLRFRKPG
jgi:predicted methyltransferase